MTILYGMNATAFLEVGRNYLGREINEKYHKLCNNRINGDLTLKNSIMYIIEFLRVKSPLILLLHNL